MSVRRKIMALIFGVFLSISSVFYSIKNGTLSEQAKKTVNYVIGISIGLVILIAVIWALSQETQYTKDYNSSRNKTWDQMTQGERAVVQDEVDWLVKDSGLYD